MSDLSTNQVTTVTGLRLRWYAACEITVGGIPLPIYLVLGGLILGFYLAGAITNGSGKYICLYQGNNFTIFRRKIRVIKLNTIRLRPGQTGLRRPHFLKFL